MSHDGFPVPLGELSVWQRSTRDDPLVNANQDAPLPPEADVVIIGSGLAGAVTAYSLLSSEKRPHSVVVLEAREACSGASGRNAGHCRPDTYRGFPMFSRKLGYEPALEVLESERVVYDRVAAFVDKHAIDCEFTPCDTFDVCLSDAFTAYASTALAAVQGMGGAADVEPTAGDEAKEATGLPATLAAFRWRAATLNPAKLCYAVHRLSLAQGGYSIYTHAPVTTVSEVGGVSMVETPRGSIRAKQVVFATNAYTSALLPEMKGLISPMRAQAVKLAPPSTPSRLAGSFSLRFLPEHFYSIAQRPDDSIVLGTSRGWQGMPQSLKDEITDCVDDSKPSDEVTHNAVGTFKELFGRTEDLNAGAHEYAWSGIIGMTPDSVPFIGKVPGKQNQWIAAGFNGHGMARIFLVAPGLAALMGGSDWEATGMPRAFEITADRLARLRSMQEGTAAVVGDLGKQSAQEAQKIQPEAARVAAAA